MTCVWFSPKPAGQAGAVTDRLPRALAWLAVTRASLADDGDTLMTSANEIRRMFTALCGPPRNEPHARHWSRWRRHHQERARHCHYQRQRRQDH